MGALAHGPPRGVCCLMTAVSHPGLSYVELATQNSSLKFVKPDNQMFPLKCLIKTCITYMGSVPRDMSPSVAALLSQVLGSLQRQASLVAQAIQCADVYVWGRGEYGRLGLGDRGGSSRLRPTRVRGLEGHCCVQASAGGTHTCVLTREGRIFTWGRGSFGRLGIGIATKDHHSPVEVLLPGMHLTASICPQNRLLQCRLPRIACDFLPWKVIAVVLGFPLSSDPIHTKLNSCSDGMSAFSSYQKLRQGPCNPQCTGIKLTPFPVLHPQFGLAGTDVKLSYS